MLRLAHFIWEFLGMFKGSTAQMAGYSAAGAVVLGLVLGLFEVQGWKMPTPVAAFILVFLFLFFAIIVAMLVIEVIKVVERFKEQRAISAQVSNNAPGILDCKVDGERATARLLAELNRWQVDIGVLSTEMKVFSSDLQDASERDNPEKQLRKANKVGKQINSSAEHVEKRIILFETLTREIIRDYELMISTLNMAVERDKISAKNLKSGFEGFDKAGTTIIEGILLGKEGAELSKQSNLTRIIREASKKLENSLGKLNSCFIQFQKDCHRLHTDLTLKLSSTPDKGDSQKQ